MVSLGISECVLGIGIVGLSKDGIPPSFLGISGS